jgi:chorismate-pyruvate lyase
MMAATLPIATEKSMMPLPPWAGLLEDFYRQDGLPLPWLFELRAAEVPEPYHRLLVHSSDMTPTLEAFYGQAMELTVLSRERRADTTYFREVLLRLPGQGRPVEYGVIRIFLQHLPPAVAQRVLEENRPLGNILQTEDVGHLSWPQNFFHVETAPRICSLLELPKPVALFGRRNVLLDSSRRLMAEVMEVLAPAEPPPPGGAGNVLSTPA